MEDKIPYEIKAGGANQKIPNQKELERELTDYFSKKYGDRVKIITPFVFPRENRMTDQPKLKGVFILQAQV